MKPTTALPAALVLLLGATLFGLWKWGGSERTDGPDPAPATPPPTAAHPPSDPAEPEEKHPFGARFMDGEFPPLSPEQIAAFVDSQNRSAAGLIAAWDLSGDESWLEAAALEHPDDPNVAVAMLTHGGANFGDAGKWIGTLLKNDPNNAVGNLFAARAAFAAGDLFSALVELRAMGNSERTDFFMASAQQSLVAAYKHAGYPDTTAKAMGMSGVKIPAAGLADLNRNLSDAMAAAHLDGDQKLVRALGEAGMAAATQSVEDDGSGYLITQLIGYSMQRRVLGQLDEFELIPGDQELVIERLDKLNQDISTIRELVGESSNLLNTITEEEAGEYFDKVQADGEMAAMRWLIENRRCE